MIEYLDVEIKATVHQIIFKIRIAEVYPFFECGNAPHPHG